MSTGFVPSASVTVTADSMPGAITMPAVDGNNVDLTVQYVGQGMAWLTFAANGAVGPSATGCVAIPSGVTLLLTENPTALAAGASNSRVRSAQGGAYATATAGALVAMMAGGKVTITRGTASAVVQFA